MKLSELAERLEVEESVLAPARECVDTLMGLDMSDALTIILAGQTNRAYKLVPDEPIVEELPAVPAEPSVVPVEEAIEPPPVAEEVAPAVELVPAEEAVPEEPVVGEPTAAEDPPADEPVQKSLADAPVSDMILAALEASGINTVEDLLSHPDLTEIEHVGDVTRKKLLEWASA